MMKRIAVYICGHLRNLDEVWSNYMQVFRESEKYIFDYYFVLWDIKNSSDKTPVAEEDILRICPQAKLIKFLNSTYEPPAALASFNPNVVKQLYGLHMCFNQLPADYDLYIRLRTDLYFFDTNFLDAVINAKAELRLVDKVWFTQTNYPHSDHFNDFFWIGDYNTSKYIADTYLCLHELYFPNAYNERILAMQIKKIPFTIKIHHFSCEFGLDRRTKGAEPWLAETTAMTRKRNQH